jgi:hypothetical protein
MAACGSGHGVTVAPANGFVSGVGRLIATGGSGQSESGKLCDRQDDNFRMQKVMYSDDIDELKAKQICFRCVGEAYLSDDIEVNGAGVQCSYCEEMGKSITLADFADRVETAFEDHYTRTADQPDSWEQALISDRESNYDWERAGESVIDAIESAAEIPRQVAADIQAILGDRHGDFDSAAMGEETEFSSDTYYEEKGTNTSAWQEEWRTFENSLKTEARFFNQTGAMQLATMFGNVDTIKTINRRPLVVHAGPKRSLNHLFRARVFQTDDELKKALCRPDQHLGSPPVRLASGGRMNAQGISVFYGATAARAAIAEVRPPVGSNVVVAKFTITRPLRLLDLTALGNAWDGGSIFDPTLRSRLERIAFLQLLGARMTQPVMPDDEAFDYLPTQAIADFLANQNKPQLDGIIFRSVQVKEGRNVVLFHKAARVEAMKLPQGTEIEAHSGYGTEEGWEIDYSVSERVPTMPTLVNEDDDCDFVPLFTSPIYLSDETDFRDVALCVDSESVSVHHVERVSFRFTTHSVSRHRSEKTRSNI